LPFLLALLALEALECSQEPRCLWLAIEHGEPLLSRALLRACG
jgi:hypothetical protein